MSELAGVLASRYRIESLIAHGGIGSTYLATDVRENKKVAVKALDFQKLEDWKVFELFQREVKTLKAVSHPLIPDYIDDFEYTTDGRKYFILVQEYVAGANLYDLIRDGRRFTPVEAAALFASILETLAYLHRLSPPVIHRDLNPKNIILTPDHKPYLVDFGAAGLVKNTLAAARSDTFVGTIGYIAPEQLYGKAGPASDIYSLGVTMLYLLTGREPSEFELKKLKLDFEEQPEMPFGLGRIISRMIEPDTAERYSTAAEIAKDLRQERSRGGDESGEFTREEKRSIPPPPPRPLILADRLRLRRRLMGDAGLFGIWFAVLGMLFVFVFVIFGRTFPAILLLGADSRAIGTVIATEDTNASENDATVYRNIFIFRASDDREYRQYSFTSGSSLPPDGEVEVRYLSSHPRLAVIKDARYSTFDPFVLFTAIFPIIGYTMMFLGRPRHPGRTARLLRRGTVAKGRVVNRLIHRTRAWLTYEYAHAGTLRRGRQLSYRPYDLETGADCLVLYRPGSRERSVMFAPGVRLKRGRWHWGEDDQGTPLSAVWQLVGYYAGWLLLALAGLIVLIQSTTGC